VYDQIKTQLDAVSELSDEQVTELQSNIISEFETVEGEDPTPETVDAMTTLADSLDIVRGELARREALAEQLAVQAAEAAARVKGTAETSGEEMAMNEEPMEEEVPVEEVPSEEGPATEIEVEVSEEEEETPMEEDEKEKEKSEMTEYSSDEEVAATVEVEEAVEEVVADAELSTTDEATEDTSIAQEDGSELSTLEETSIQETTIAPEEQEEQAPVTTPAEQSFEAPADRQPVIQVTEAPVAITAGADIPGYTAGTALSSMNEVAQAMEKRLHTLRRVNGGDGEQHIVASFTTSYPEDRVLTTDAESNAQKIAAVAGPEALVASGGHSAPFEVKYDIYSIGSTSVRPLRDALPRFQADRGGIRYITPPSFANVASNTTTYSSAVGIWTSANDSAETPSPSAKLSLTVAAAQEVTAQTDAVTLQLQFGNLMTRAYPELIARHNELALVQHAREAEENLVSGINSGSTAVTTTNLIGFGRDFLVQVRRAAAGYRARHRLSPDARLKVVIPVWVYDAMAADLALAMPGDGTLSVSKSEIDGYLAALNVDVVTVLDSTGSLAQSLNMFQAAAALNEFPDTFKWFLFAEGTFLFLDGGTLDLGIIRDSTLVGTNDYKMFIETFEAVAKVGIESLAITSTINVNGAAAALRDTTGGTAAATIEL
jgi:hypothetical protein